MIQSKMNKLAWRQHFPIISLWQIFLMLKGSWLCSQWSDLAEIRTRPRFLCMSSLPVSIKWLRSKTTEKRWRHRFPHYKSMGAFCCHRNQSFNPVCPKILCSLSTTPVMLHIKFDQDWPTGFRDIQVWKCGWRRQMDDGPLVYYKLTLWAFGSGELKTNTFWVLSYQTGNERPMHCKTIDNVIWMYYVPVICNQGPYRDGE